MDWKIRTSVSHGSTKKERKTKEFPRIEGTILRCGEKDVTVEARGGESDVGG
jgi:hypothetical protein